MAVAINLTRMWEDLEELQAEVALLTQRVQELEEQAPKEYITTIKPDVIETRIDLLTERNITILPLNDWVIKW
jgi:3-dehydroquinate dehydratase